MNYISLLRRSFPVYFFYLGLDTLDFFWEDYCGLADLVGEISKSAVPSIAFSVSVWAGSAEDGASFDSVLLEVVSSIFSTAAVVVVSSLSTAVFSLDLVVSV